MKRNLVVVMTIIVGVVVFLAFQMVLPFPYGLVVGLGVSGALIYYSMKKTSADENSLVNLRRIDPSSYKEREQNREAYRILKKKFLEEKITKDEFERLAKEFEGKI